jgi:hypothetical protein
MCHIYFVELACRLCLVQQPACGAVKFYLHLCKWCVFGQLEPSFGGGGVGENFNAHEYWGFCQANAFVLKLNNPNVLHALQYTVNVIVSPVKGSCNQYIGWGIPMYPTY